MERTKKFTRLSAITLALVLVLSAILGMTAAVGLQRTGQTANAEPQYDTNTLAVTLSENYIDYINENIGGETDDKSLTFPTGEELVFSPDFTYKTESSTTGANWHPASGIFVISISDDAGKNAALETLFNKGANLTLTFNGYEQTYGEDTNSNDGYTMEAHAYFSDYGTIVFMHSYNGQDKDNYMMQIVINFQTSGGGQQNFPEGIELYVAGVDILAAGTVTTANEGVESGTATVRYDEEDLIVVVILENFLYSGEGHEGSAIYFKGSEYCNRLAIGVIGENILECQSNNDAGMIYLATPGANLFLYGSLSGDGALSLNGNYYGIMTANGEQMTSIGAYSNLILCVESNVYAVNMTNDNDSFDVDATAAVTLLGNTKAINGNNLCFRNGGQAWDNPQHDPVALEADRGYNSEDISSYIKIVTTSNQSSEQGQGGQDTSNVKYFVDLEQGDVIPAYTALMYDEDGSQSFTVYVDEGNEMGWVQVVFEQEYFQEPLSYEVTSIDYQSRELRLVETELSEQQNVPEGAELWVAGVDILAAGTVSTETAGVSNGTATVRYDAENDDFFLTIENFQYSGDGHNGSAIYFKGTESCNKLMIVVIGENDIVCTSNLQTGVITLATSQAGFIIEGNGNTDNNSLYLRGYHYGILTSGGRSSISFHGVQMRVEANEAAVKMVYSEEWFEIDPYSAATLLSDTTAVEGGRLYLMNGGQAWDDPQNDPVTLGEDNIYENDQLSSYYKIVSTYDQSGGQGQGGNDPVQAVYFVDLTYGQQLSAGTKIMYDENHSMTFEVIIDGGNLVDVTVDSLSAEPYYILTVDVTVVDPQEYGPRLYLTSGQSQLPEGELYIAGVDIVQAGGIINAQTPGIVGTISGSVEVVNYGDEYGQVMIYLNSFQYEGAGCTVGGITAGILYTGPAYLIFTYHGDNSLVVTGENVYGIYSGNEKARVMIRGNSGNPDQDTFTIRVDGGYGIGGVVGEDKFIVIGGNMTVSGFIGANLSQLDVYNPDGGTVNIIGTEQAVLNKVRSNDLTGTGWTDTAGTQGETSISATEMGSVEVPQYKRLQFTGTTGQGGQGQGGGSGSGDPIALVGESTYTDLISAYNAVAEGGTIKLLDDVDLSTAGENYLSIEKNITFDLNGHVLTLNNDGNIIIVIGGAVLTLDNSVPATGGVVGFCGVDYENDSYILLRNCRLIITASDLTDDLALLNHIDAGYEIADIESSDPAYALGFRSIVQPIVKPIAVNTVYYIGEKIEFSADTWIVYMNGDGDLYRTANVLAGSYTVIAPGTYSVEMYHFLDMLKYASNGSSLTLSIHNDYDLVNLHVADIVGIRCTGGDGTQSDPFAFAVVYNFDDPNSGSGSGDPTPATHTHNDITFTAWESATGLPNEAGNYYLTADVTISSTWSVPSGTTNLCLNGFGIKMTGNDSAVYVGSGRTLNLYDCGETTHYFNVDGNSVATGINDNSGSNSFVGGYVTGGRGKASTGNKNGGGVFIDGTFNLYGGNIIGNQVTVSDNCGAGVYCNDNSTFHMYGGCISYNYAQNAGCAIFGWHNCAIEIHGGEIAHNKTSHSYGSAISFWNPSGYTVSLKLYGGVIHDNLSGGSGGAVILSTNGFTVGMKGNLIVRDNTTSSTANNATLNVYVGSTPINIEGALTNTEKIGIRLASGTGVFTSGWSTYMGDADPADHFYSENEAYGVYLLDGEVAILAEAPTPVAHVHNYSTDWSKDGSTHWHACLGNGECDAPKEDEAAHTYGEDVSEASYYICSVCDYENEARKAEYESNQGGQGQGSQQSANKPIALDTTYFFGENIVFSGGEYVYYYVPNDWKNAIQAGTYEVRRPDTYSSGYFFFNDWLTGVSGGTVDACATFPGTDWNFDSFTGIRCSGGDGSEESPYTFVLITDEPESGDPTPAAHTHNDITFTAWESTTSLPSEAGNYYLTADVTISSTWNVPSGITNLCLNGHVISAASNVCISVITVKSGSTLNLYDCDTTTHYYYVDASTYKQNRASNRDKMYDIGEIAADGPTNARYVAATKKGTFKGGYITGGTGQGLTSNSNNISGGGFQIYGGGTLNMYGGCVFGNYTSATSSQGNEGGGVYVYADGVFNMYGGYIIGNQGGNACGGVQNLGTFTMNDGYIGHNTAGDGGWANGGGVGNSGTMTMNGGVIEGNEAGGHGGLRGKCGGAIENNGSLTINGGFIINNFCDNLGGGIYMSSASASLTIGANATITGNYNDETKKADNVYLGQDKMITLGSALTENNSVGVTLKSGEGVFTSGWSTYMDGKDPADYFVSDNADYTVALQDGEAKLVAVTKYDLYIAGTQATSEALSGEGWSYDPDTNTLTLNNFTYEGEGSDDSHFWHFNSVVTYAGADTFYLIIEGTNSITNTKNDYDNVMALFCTSDMIIGGNGTLTLNAPNTATNMSTGLCVDGKLLISGGVITVNSGASEWRSAGICVFGMRFIQTGGSVVAVADEEAEESYGLYVLGEAQVYNGAPQEFTAADVCDGITIGVGIKKLVAVGYTSALYTKGTFDFKRDATAWTDANKSADGAAVSAGEYGKDDLSDYKYIDFKGYVPLDTNNKPDIEVPEDKEEAEDGDEISVDTDATPVEVKWYYDDDGDGQPDGEPIGEGETYQITFPKDEGHTIIGVVTQNEDENGDPYPEGEKPTVTTNPVKVEGELPEPIVWRIRMKTKTSVSDGVYAQIAEEYLEENEKIYSVCDVKLIQVITEDGEEREVSIQPSDIEEGLELSIKMTVPASLRGKEFRILHIHTASDVEFVEYTLSADGNRATVRVDRLSEFAFVAEKPQENPGEGGETDPTDPEGQGGSNPSNPGEGGNNPNTPEEQPIPTEPAPTTQDDPTIDNWTLTPQGQGGQSSGSQGQGGQGQSGQGGQGQSEQGEGSQGQGSQGEGEQKPQQPVVTVALEDCEPQEGVTVEVEVKAEVSQDIVESDNSVYADRIKDDDEIAIVYEVKLIRITTEDGVEVREEIQPSDIKPGAVVVINMEIPEELRGKTFKVMHIHAENDITEIPASDYSISEDGTVLTVRVTRLSEFAFVCKKAADTGNGGNDVEEVVEAQISCPGWISVVLGLIVLALFICIAVLIEIRFSYARKFFCYVGLMTSGALIIAAIVIFAVHACVVSVAGFGVCALDFLLFVLYGPTERKGSRKIIKNKIYPAVSKCCKKVASACKKAIEKVKPFVRKAINGCKKCCKKVKLFAEDLIAKIKKKPAAAEPIAEEEPVAVEETQEPAKVEEPKEEELSLKESLAMATVATRSEKITKAYVRGYLAEKYPDVVEINTRGNYTKTGLPLADTHYVKTSDGKDTCFIYVYETEGATMLLLKTKDELGEELAKDYETVRRSAFPKAKDRWYSVVIDDSITDQEVKHMIDRTIAVYTGATVRKKTFVREEGLSLKESLSLASAVSASEAWNADKTTVSEYLEKKYEKAVKINRRGNKTKTGLPLADTHYVVREEGSECFVYVYEVDDRAVLLTQLGNEYAKKLSEKHKNVRPSAFPKSKKHWYTVVVDDTFTKADVENVLAHSYEHVKKGK